LSGEEAQSSVCHRPVVVNRDDESESFGLGNLAGYSWRHRVKPWAKVSPENRVGGL